MEQLPPEQIDLALQWIAAIIVLVALGAGLASMLVGKVMAWQEQRAAAGGGVKVMSNAAPSMALQPSVSTDQTAQTADQTIQTASEDDIKAARRKELLGVYRTLRAVPGMTREQGRAILAAVNMPLDNNLWAEAKADAPPPAEERPRTPWGDRPYNPADFYEDEPELRYSAPAKA